MEWLESLRKSSLVLRHKEKMRVIGHQAIGNGENADLSSVVNKLFKEENPILVVEEDIGTMVSPLGNMMKEVGHYDSGSSWHAATIDSRNGKLPEGEVCLG